MRTREIEKREVDFFCHSKEFFFDIVFLPRIQGFVMRNDLDKTMMQPTPKNLRGACSQAQHCPSRSFLSMAVSLDFVPHPSTNPPAAKRGSSRRSPDTRCAPLGFLSEYAGGLTLWMRPFVYGATRKTVQGHCPSDYDVFFFTLGMQTTCSRS